MAIKSRNVLKKYFKNEERPNERQFWDLIDSLIHIDEGDGSSENSPAGSGIVNGITTDEDGNIVFNFVVGNTISITSNGAVGVVKMPIPYVDSYDNFYFVSDEKGNDKTGLPNSYRFYKSIVAASEAAKKDYDITGKKNMVYVFKGTYKEESVNRNHVDMYFEDGAVVWTEGVDSSVINDKLEALTNTSIYGKGTFVSKENTGYDDREGINLRQASTIYVEAKLIDSIQLFADFKASITIVNADIIFRFSSRHDKNLHFKNCRFLNGTRISTSDHRGENSFENCEFILPQYNTEDIRNKTLDIKNYNEQLLFRIERNDPVGNKISPIDITSKSSDTIIKESYDIYTANNAYSNPEVSCIFYSLNSSHKSDEFDLKITNSTFRIQKENCSALIFSKRKNSTSKEGLFTLENITIIDETISKDTTAFVTAWGDAATKQPELLINGLSHNCGTGEKLLAEGLNKWEITFDNISNFVPKEGGTFEGQVFISDSDTNSPGISLNPNGNAEIDGQLTSKELKINDKIEIDQSFYSDTDGKFYLKSKDNQYWSHVFAPEKRQRRFNNGKDYSLQENYVEDLSAFDYKETLDRYKHLDNGAVFFRLTNKRSQIAVGYGDKAYGITGYPGWEINDNFLTPKGYIADFRTNKLRVLEGNAEIDGVLEVKEILENGVRVATQSWVNTALAGLGATNVKVPDADLLDGIDSTAFAKQEIIPAATLKVGWYTVAVNAGNRASAKFVLRETRSGRHGSIHFYAAHNFGNGNVITVLSNSWHSGGGSIRYLRLKDYDTYDGVVLQAYIDTDDAPVSGLILEDIQANGWTPKAWVPDATDPGDLKDYSKLINIPAEIDLDKTLGINTSADMYAKGHLVFHECNKPTAEDIGALTLASNEVNLDTDSFLRSDADDTFTGKLSIGSTSKRQGGIYGVYDSKKIGHIWSMGTAYKIAQDGADFGNMYGFAYKHTNNVVGGTMASGHQAIWCANGVPQSSLGVNIWTAGDVSANGTYYKGDGKNIIQFSDTWLRLNPSSQFTEGIYCGTKTLRTDGQFQVGESGSKFKVETNGNTTVYGNISGKSVDGQYSHLYKFGGLHFTWDSDTYGTNAQHSIKSAYGTSMGDSLTINSYNNIRLNIDSNNNNTDSKFEIGHNTSGVANVVFSVDESGNTALTGDLLVKGNKVYHEGNKLTAADVGALAVTAKAADSDKLDGLNSTSLLRSDADDTFTGKLSVGSTSKRQAGIYGVYDSKKIGQIWSMGTAYKIAEDGADFGNMYGFAYKHTNNTVGGTLGSGHQAVWCANGVPKSALGDNIWTAGNISANGTYYNGDGKRIIQFSDSWLRLNPSSQFTSGIYCGASILRTDGEFQVGSSGSKFKVDTSGNVVASGNVSAYSDRRLKKAIKPVTDSFLDKIDQLKPSFYQWKDKAKEQTEQLGFIAQEVMELFPQWVHKNEEHYSVSYDKMGAVLAVKGIQELYKEINELKMQLKELSHGITN